MAETNGAFFEEFLDDYFAECDEHLAAVRRNLLALESDINQSKADPTLIDELFRRFHTLKGLSGMVGVTSAELLAHQIENCLRALKKEQLALTADTLDALMVGTHQLEQVIAAYRSGQDGPDISPILAQLAALSLEPAAEAAPNDTAAPGTVPAPPPQIEEPAPEQIWRFVFKPAIHLANRGINVNTIRDRLQSLGRITKAVPALTGDGNVAFEFLVAGRWDVDALNGWQNDGLVWTPDASEPGSTQPPQPNLPTPEKEKAETPALPPVTGTTPSLMPSNVVRVDLSRLDELMQIVGNLVVSRARLADNLTGLKSTTPPARWHAMQEATNALERQLRDLREGMMRMRLVPIGEVFERMRFVIRDLARESKKQINLEVSGRDTEIDKFVVEQMMDPLLHLVRNAVSHGLEPAEERAAQGKPAAGNISLRAAAAGDTVLIEIEDDGRGIHAQQVAQKAQSLGLWEPGPNGSSLDSETLLDILCAPGFSTRQQADRASGRGVGMEAVNNGVQKLGGRLSLASTPGQGSRFTIELPLTLAIMDGLIVAAGGQRYAVPLPAIREIFELDPTTVTVFENNNRLMAYREGVLPLIHLAQRFGLPEQPQQKQYTLVAGHGSGAMGLVVDQILGQREMVVRSIADPLAHSPGIAGATELGDGQLILILDIAALSRLAGVS